MREISRIRMDALAGYARNPMTVLAAEEIAWFEHETGNAVGIVIRDRTDNDFAGVVFGRDAQQRFRATDLTEFVATPLVAQRLLNEAIDEAAAAAPEVHHQGDEVGLAIDFFALSRPRAQLNPNFLNLAELLGYSSARAIIEPMMRWYEDADGNFVEQFQTTGFDQRIWELYLFAMLIENGCVLDRAQAVPDFNVWRFGLEFCIEAVTVGPTRLDGAIVPPPPLNTDEQRRFFLREYMPIKFGSPLFSKLQRRYWERPNVAGKPLLFAIEDFSAPGSMSYTSSALDVYLYGYDHDWAHEADGSLTIVPRRVEHHTWGDKRIPSGFFDLDGAEHVSAVLFSNSGTVAKFNRMGVLGGFGSDRVLMIREGTVADPDPNAAAPLAFRQVVNAPDYLETWMEGLNVFHNPSAVIPLPQDAFPGAAHHYLEPDGQRRSMLPAWQPIGSVTRILADVDVDEVLREMAERSRS